MQELALYAERFSWEAQGCGKETLQMRQSGYLMPYEGRSISAISISNTA